MPIDLNGLGVLVTRPKGQGKHLSRMIVEANGKVVRFPVLEISPPAEPQQVDRVLNRLDEYHMAVFISANAVIRGMEWVKRKRDALPEQLQVATVGAQSAQTLRDYGVQAPICPEEIFNSEALLALEPMHNVRNKNILIFRGEGGREVLAHELRARGAHVDYAQVYRRTQPKADPAPLLQHWQRGDIDICVVTSNEGLTNLNAMLGESGAGFLRNTPLLVVSERAKALAQSLHIQTVLVAAKASDEGIMHSLSAFGADRAPSPTQA